MKIFGKKDTVSMKQKLENAMSRNDNVGRSTIPNSSDFASTDKITIESRGNEFILTSKEYGNFTLAPKNNKTADEVANLIRNMDDIYSAADYLRNQPERDNVLNSPANEVSQNKRFVIEKQDDEFIFTDKVTGQMAISPTYGKTMEDVSYFTRNCADAKAAADYVRTLPSLHRDPFENLQPEPTDVIEPIGPKDTYDSEPLEKPESLKTVPYKEPEQFKNMNQESLKVSQKYDFKLTPREITNDTVLLFEQYDPYNGNKESEKRTVEETKKYIVSHWLDHAQNNVASGEFDSAEGWMKDATEVMQMTPKTFVEEVLESNPHNYQNLQDIGLYFSEVYEQKVKVAEVGENEYVLYDKFGFQDMVHSENLTFDQINEIVENCQDLKQAKDSVIDVEQTIDTISNNTNTSHDDIDHDL